MKRKSKICIGIVLILIIGCIIIYHEFNFVLFKTNFKVNSIGIIDGYLSDKDYENLDYMSSIMEKEVTHGDMLIDYLNSRNYKGTIAYYPAVDNKGTITSEKIIEALNWMNNNGIKLINISLSTKKYDEDLNTWLDENPDVTVFCSYSNQDNTYDYPAMYTKVIASGTSNNILYKEKDVRYHSNLIIVWNKGFHFYNGDYFLSIETLLDDEGTGE